MAKRPSHPYGFRLLLAGIGLLLGLFCAFSSKWMVLDPSNDLFGNVAMLAITFFFSFVGCLVGWGLDHRFPRASKRLETELSRSSGDGGD